MFPARGILFAAASALLVGCGTYVPDIQEFWGTPTDATFMVNKVSAQSSCAGPCSRSFVLSLSNLSKGLESHRRHRAVTWDGLSTPGRCRLRSITSSLKTAR